MSDPATTATTATPSLITITFKVSGGQEFVLNLDPSLTILQIKVLSEAHCGFKPAEQRLIYRGKILKDDQTLSSYNVGNSHVMHLVKASTAQSGATQTQSAPQTAPQSQPPSVAQTVTTSGTTPPPATPNTTFVPDVSNSQFGGVPGTNTQLPFRNTAIPGMMPTGIPGFGGGMPDPQQIASLMENPFVQQMIHEMTRNPEMFRTLLSGNPMFQQFSQQHPMLRNIMDNPELMRGMLSPQFIQASLEMQQMSQQMQRAMQPQEGETNAAAQPQQPLTTNPLFSAPNQTATTNTAPSLNQSVPPNVNDVTGFNRAPTAGLGQTSGANPNPYGDVLRMLSDNEMMRNLISNSGMFGGGYQGANQTGNANVAPADRYRDSLDRLHEMGFIDREANLQALIESNGSVDGAITRLLDRGIGN